MAEYVLEVECENGYEFATGRIDSREEAEGLRDAMLFTTGSSDIEIREVSD